MMGWTGNDLMPVDFCFAAYLTAFMPGAVEKAWGDLSGPASIGKTEILRCFEDGEQRTIALDNLTTNAFSSAFREEDKPDDDKSLCYLLSMEREPVGPKVLILKDMSSIFNMSKEKVSKLLSDLRTAFDGSYANMAGNLGLDIKKNLKFGLLTSCTEVGDEFRKNDQSLGSRTFIIRMGASITKYEARRTLAIGTLDTDAVKWEFARAKLRTIADRAIRDAIQRIKETGGKVLRTPELAEKVGVLAAIGTSIRTVPTSKDAYARYSEGPSRMAKQLKVWVDCRAIIDGRDVWNNDDFSLIKRIVQDTMPPTHLNAIRVLWRGGYERAITPMSADDIRKKANLPSDFWRQLKQWDIINILQEHDEGAYSIHPTFAKDIKLTGFMEDLANGPTM